jgi:hypothetical protein
MPSSDSFHPQLDVNWEIVYEILADLEDIKSALEEGKNPSHILFPLFDPFKTIGKYC